MIGIKTKQYFKEALFSFHDPIIANLAVEAGYVTLMLIINVPNQISFYELRKKGYTCHQGKVEFLMKQCCIVLIAYFFPNDRAGARLCDLSFKIFAKKLI